MNQLITNSYLFLLHVLMLPITALMFLLHVYDEVLLQYTLDYIENFLQKLKK